jgi:hypothetical protein
MLNESLKLFPKLLCLLLLHLLCRLRLGYLTLQVTLLGLGFVSPRFQGIHLLALTEEARSQFVDLFVLLGVFAPELNIFFL